MCVCVCICMEEREREREESERNGVECSKVFAIHSEVTYQRSTVETMCSSLLSDENGLSTVLYKN